MQLYTIMPLDTNHVDEICEDIKKQFEDGIANVVLFSVKLVPEGTPPVDKASEFAQKYDIFKEKLVSMGAKNGILVQATIGHGGPFAEASPFQKYVNLTDGKTESVHCPYDDFCAYIKEAMAILASHAPDVIMVDDDFRLMERGGNGCACPLHMAEFNRRAGTEISTAELLGLLAGNDCGTYQEIFIETQRDSLLKAARAMREGIDRIDPSIPGVFCGVGNNVEFAEEIAQILAGEGNPVVVRINNSNYTAAGPRGFSRVSYRAAAEIEHLKGKVDVILAETDNFDKRGA